MDIILESGLPHQQIPVDRIVQVLNDSYKLAKQPKYSYQNPIPNFQGVEFDVRKVIGSPEMKPYNEKAYGLTDGVLNLDIKMETGTGKTYVYTQTIYELHAKFGINKFIIVVPSLPVKLGTVGFITDPYVRHYFKETLGYNCDIELCEVVAMKKKSKGHNFFPSSVRDFVNGSNQQKNKIYVLITNQQLLQKGKVLDNSNYDITLHGFTRPLDAIKATNPFLIIDEPHRFNREKTTYKRIVDEIHPQCIVRFGATFPSVSAGKGKTRKDYINLLYNLTACDAFNDNLIKGIAKEHFNPVNSKGEKIKVIAIENGGESVSLHYLNDKRSQHFEMHKGDSLAVISPKLEGLSILGISKKSIELSNGQEKKVGDEFTADIYSTSYQEQMIRLALDRHFETERKLFNRESKIKSLALFFIDNIESFRGDENKNGAWLREMFNLQLEEHLKAELKNSENSADYTDYLNASLVDIAKCSAGYFARDNSDSDEDIADEVNDILRNKKELLSLKDEKGKWNVRRFLFSKWTLKEGWDNPNVFTIAKLRSSGSEESKLQEVGRGLRLPVDEYGNRIKGTDFMLNYIVDFTEKDFASQLVKEINGDLKFTSSDKIIIPQSEIAKTAELRNVQVQILQAEMLLSGLVTLDENGISVNEGSIVEFMDKYPEIGLGVNIDRVQDRNKTTIKKSVIIRKDRFEDLRSLWNELNRKYLMFYQPDINKVIEQALPEIIEDGVFTRMSISSEREEVKTDNTGAHTVKEENKVYIVQGKTMTYNEFLRLANQETSIPIKIIHDALCKYSRNHGKLSSELFNTVTLANLQNKFYTWKLDNLGGRIEYKQANYRTRSTALTDDKGRIRDDVAIGRIGVCTTNGKTPDKYLYDTMAYDSPLELKNILDNVDNDVVDLVVYGKIPRNSIRIPNITKDSYSPDFMYVVHSKDGKTSLNVVIETKDVTQDAVLRGPERAKISNAERFFKQISNDFPDCKVYFKRQINHQTINVIIDNIMQIDNK